MRIPIRPTLPTRTVGSDDQCPPADRATLTLGFAGHLWRLSGHVDPKRYYGLTIETLDGVQSAFVGVEDSGSVKSFAPLLSEGRPLRVIGMRRGDDVTNTGAREVLGTLAFPQSGPPSKLKPGTWPTMR